MGGAARALQQEVRVSFRAGDDHIHPDPHGFRRRRDHVVDSVVRLDAEGE